MLPAIDPNCPPNRNQNPSRHFRRIHQAPAFGFRAAFLSAFLAPAAAAFLILRTSRPQGTIVPQRHGCDQFCWEDTSYETPVTTPNRNTWKRNADHLGDANDGLPLPSLELSLIRTNGNHLGAITSFAARKRLRPEQLTAVEAFAKDPLPVQLGKLYATCLANENTLAKFQVAKPHKLFQYKGETGKNDILALLCRHRWGNFVVGTEHDRAAMDLIQKFIGDAFTQSRSIIKKEIVKSVETPRVKGSQTHIATLRPNATHITIYQLTKTIIQKLSGGKVVSIPITPALCGRIALMRKWHVKKVGKTVKKSSETDDYWQLVDEDLREIRESARENTTDANAIAKHVGK
ncbi:hypothetical protein B0H13DRAFT_1904226 [Mycena leptocephala]|nr:hypothetical protein B0H13DRAFT_1904226 [Mycena leptocephala]